MQIQVFIQLAGALLLSLATAVMADDRTVIIPGQSTLEQIQAAEPTRDFDGKYGDGFIKNTAFVAMLYKDTAPD